MPRILIADDEWVTRVEIEEMLNDLGYEVVGQAETGAEAVEMVRDLEPDLIIMDVVMPGEMNGIEAARVIKAESETPIIFVTGYGDPEYIEAVKEIAPFGYVMKPFDEREIHAFIEIALSKRELELKLMKAHEGLERANLILQEEIASRKKTEKALRESEEKLRAINDTALDSIFCKDISQQYTFVNPAMIQLFGCTEEDLIGKVPEEVFDKKNAAIVNEVDARTFNGEKISEIRTLAIAGKSYTFHTIQVPLRNVDGNITGISGIVRDITNRKLIEEELRESEERYRTLAQYSRTGIYIHVGGLVKFVNNRFAETLGYTPEEIVGHQYWTFVHPEDREMVRDISLARSRGEAAPAEYEFRHLSKDGKTVWVSNLPTIVQFQGQTANMGNLTYINDRIKAEEERQQLISELQETLDNVKTLSGLLPICLHCKKIRDDQGYWKQIESYIEDHSDAEFSHGICRECAKKYYPEMDLYGDD